MRFQSFDDVGKRRAGDEHFRLHFRDSYLLRTQGLQHGAAGHAPRAHVFGIVAKKRHVHPP